MLQIRAFAVALLFCLSSVGMRWITEAGELKVWRYEGVFVTVPLEYREAGLKPGDVFYGGFEFDPSTPDLSAATDRGTYSLLSSFVTVPATGSGWVFEGEGSGKAMSILPGWQVDYDFFEVYQRDTPLDQGYPAPTKLVFFNGRAAKGLFSSDALPEEPPPVSAFEWLNLQYTDAGLLSSAQGVVTRLYSVSDSSVNTVPESGSSCVLLVMAIALLTPFSTMADNP